MWAWSDMVLTGMNQIMECLPYLAKNREHSSAGPGSQYNIINGKIIKLLKMPPADLGRTLSFLCSGHTGFLSVLQGTFPPIKRFCVIQKRRRQFQGRSVGAISSGSLRWGQRAFPGFHMASQCNEAVRKLKAILNRERDWSGGLLRGYTREQTIFFLNQDRLKREIQEKEWARQSKDLEERNNRYVRPQKRQNSLFCEHRTIFSILHPESLVSSPILSSYLKKYCQMEMRS